MPPELNFSPLRVMDSRLLNTCTRANGVFSPHHHTTVPFPRLPLSCNRVYRYNVCHTSIGGFIYEQRTRGTAVTVFM